MDSLKKRWISAIILMPLVISSIIYLPLTILKVLILLFTFGLGWEWSRLCHTSVISQIIYTFLVVFLAYPSHSTLSFQYTTLGSFCWLAMSSYLFYLILNPHFLPIWSSVYRRILGLICIPAWSHSFYLLLHSQKGIALCLLLFLLVWGADTSAYFIGKKWGNKKLAPSISPNKTLAGFYGSFLASIPCILIGIAVLHLNYIWILICIITILFANMGDLSESYLKRQASVKDSGSLIPGHGGLLDRLDSLMAASPYFYISCFILLNI